MRQKSSKLSGVNLGLIVTPMLDMSFQLLAFFIMVYSPNTGEEFIGGDVSKIKSTPGVAAVKGPGIAKTDIPPIPTDDTGKLDIEQTMTIFLTNNDPRLPPGRLKEKRIDGVDVAVEPNFIKIKTPWNPLDKVEPGKADVNLIDRLVEGENTFPTLQKVLSDHYKTLLGKEKKEADPKKKDESGFRAKIKIEAERDVQFDYVIQVYAICRRVGFEEIIFVTPVD